jgi:hypothetical protein
MSSRRGIRFQTAAAAWARRTCDLVRERRGREGPGLRRAGPGALYGGPRWLPACSGTALPTAHCIGVYPTVCARARPGWSSRPGVQVAARDMGPRGSLARVACAPRSRAAAQRSDPCPQSVHYACRPAGDAVPFLAVPPGTGGISLGIHGVAAQAVTPTTPCTRREVVPTTTVPTYVALYARVVPAPAGKHYEGPQKD